MKKSPCRNFFSCLFIAAVLGFLTIFAHHVSGADIKPDWDSSVKVNTYKNKAPFTGKVVSLKRFAEPLPDRQLNQAGARKFYLLPSSSRGLIDSEEASFPTRRLETTEEDEDDSSNLLHINLQQLSSLLDCQDGCTAAFALITSPQCNSTDALEAALEFKLEKELTFDKTHIEIDENAPDKGWVTKPFRELANKSTDNSTASSAPPITLAEFVTAAAMVTEFIDAMTPNQDFNLAVYLYNNETEPLACATLELVTADEELQEYYNLFGGGDGGEGSDAVEGGEEPVAALGNASPLPGGFLAYAVAGVSIVMSAILFA